jgi:hypothetical protein
LLIAMIVFETFNLRRLDIARLADLVAVWQVACVDGRTTRIGSRLELVGQWVD